jgi:hypothetical protein
VFASLLNAAKAALSPPADSGWIQYVKDELAHEPPESWRVGLGEMWCHAWPRGQGERDQGWKLHLSATSRCAALTLRRVVPILLRHGCPSKFASTLDRLDLLNAAHYPRAGGGKFITAYQIDDAQFRRLAEELSAATTGLYGPRILSDALYRPGSVVHYRYGGFRRAEALSNDAELVLTVTAPGGHAVPDRREIFGPPPSWAPAPFPARRIGHGSAGRIGTDRPATSGTARPAAVGTARPAASGTARPAAPAVSGAVLLNGRFVAWRAIRHSNRGAVFEASDTRTEDTGTEAKVVVKQARRHVLGNAGVPAVDALRHEAEVLAALAPLGLTPRPVDLFEQDGDLFLAEESIDGVSLRLWVRQRAYVIGQGTPDHRASGGQTPRRSSTASSTCSTACTAPDPGGPVRGAAPPGDRPQALRLPAPPAEQARGKTPPNG